MGIQIFLCDPYVMPLDLGRKLERRNVRGTPGWGTSGSEAWKVDYY